MYLLVGLGNPGREHQHQRHNIGFMAIDAIARAHHASDAQQKFKGELCEARIASQKCLLLKPQTYMNTSGVSVAEAAHFYKIPLEKIIVLYDELDLVFGKVRCKQGGGAGGHNGIRSIDSHLGKNYWRIRLGIDHPGDKNRVTGHVLSNFTKDEQAHVDHWLSWLADDMALILEQNEPDMATRMEQFMTKIAHSCPPPHKEKDEKSA